MKKSIVNVLCGLAIMSMSAGAFAASNIVSESGMVSDLHRNGLQKQMDRQVDLRDSQAGVGVYADQNMISGGGNVLSLGVEGAYKVADQVVVGGSIQAPISDKMPGAYKTRGTKGPSVAAYSTYSENKDGTGVQAKLSAAYGQQKLGVKDFGEAGNTRLYGYGVQAQAGYGLDYAGVVVTPYTGISYTSMKQNAFGTENAHVGKFSEERTSMQFGVKADYRIDQTFSVDADTGVHANLGTNRHYFKGTSEDLVIADGGNDNKAQPFINVGLTADLDNVSSVRLSGGAKKQSYANTAGVVDLSYQYRF